LGRQWCNGGSGSGVLSETNKKKKGQKDLGKKKRMRSKGKKVSREKVRGKNGKMSMRRNPQRGRGPWDIGGVGEAAENSGGVTGRV